MTGRDVSIGATGRDAGDTHGRAPGPAHTGIQDLARRLGVTHRTLRFYEDQGLIEPQRVGNTRIYSRRDVGRMQLILRGKRLGFSIREIREFLDLYDTDPQHVEQMALLADKVRRRIADLEQQRVALEETLAELTQIERDARAWIAQSAAGRR